MSRAIWKRKPLPDDIREALDATGLPWAIEPGGRSGHRKLMLNGALVGIMPMKGPDTNSIARKNLVAKIRRLAVVKEPEE